MKKYIAIIFSILFITTIFAQEEDFGDFGFDEDETTENQESQFSVEVHGNMNIGFSLFFMEFKDGKSFGDICPQFPLWGKINLNANAPMVKAFFGVNLSDKTLPISMGEKTEIFPKVIIPRWIDEAYMEITLDPVIIGAGLKKFNWGIANSLSILDIINPIDKSDFSITNTQDKKIATPAFYLEAYLPLDMKLSIVYLPILQPNHNAKNGRWQSFDFQPSITTNTKTNTLKYSQAGIRYTATINDMHDLGVQYFYGFKKDPIFKNSNTEFEYEQYHHVGLNYGTGIGPVAVQAELATNIINKRKSNNTYKYTPEFLWNIGLDYSMPYNLNINLQVAESIMLSKTNTKINFALSQRVLRGSMEWKIATLVGIEDKDFMITPSLNWILGSFTVDCSLGFFAGDKKGKLGKFYNNHFLKLSLEYKF